MGGGGLGGGEGDAAGGGGIGGENGDGLREGLGRGLGEGAGREVWKVAAWKSVEVSNAPAVWKHSSWWGATALTPGLRAAGDATTASEFGPENSAVVRCHLSSALLDQTGEDELEPSGKCRVVNVVTRDDVQLWGQEASRELIKRRVNAQDHHARGNEESSRYRGTRGIGTKAVGRSLAVARA